MNKTFFSDVNDTKDTWSILAKVLGSGVSKERLRRFKNRGFATHKNLIGKLKDEPREGMVYNFQNFQVLENDDKYRITTDVIGFLQAFGCLQDQRRECDIIKRLNFSIADQRFLILSLDICFSYNYLSENTINVALWGDCTEETFGKKHENMEPPITVLVRFARLNRNTDYGHLSNAFNATLVTLNPNIPEANLMEERLSQYSLGTQLFSQVSSADYPTYSAESMLSFRTRIPLCEIAKLDQECDIVTKVTIQKCETLYGKLIVPLLKRPPEELEQLFFNKDSSHAKKFLRNIRLYDNMFSFTSMGGRIDHSINSKGGGPYSFVLSGQNYHLIGSLLPPQGNPSVYAQLYIYDAENEVSN
ncbi:hypothetical protein K1719_008680 [Acacia pycnantha]|nr:hypothetical protein K1719_008680 [Acacia pycnantha]